MYFNTPSGNKITSSDRNNYATIALFPNDPEPKRGDDVIVVSVIYTDGDSYNTYPNQKNEVYAFTNMHNAFILMDEIQKAAEHNSRARWNNNEAIQSVTVDGVTVSISQWTGYFEHIDNVIIEKFWYIGDKEN